MTKTIWGNRTVAAVRAVRNSQGCSLLTAKRIVEARCLLDGIRDLRAEGVIDTRLAEILEHITFRLQP